MDLTRIFVLSVLLVGYLTNVADCGCAACTGVCAREKIDLTFVVDGSGSICRNSTISNCANWKSIQNFIKGITNYLNIGPDQDRVAFVQFGNEGTREFGLSKYTSHISLSAAISAVSIKDENTNTSGGIKVMRTEVFATAEDRPEVSNVGIVISDGKSTRDTQKTTLEARRAEEADIRMYSVGITRQVDKKEVRDISSAPRLENTTYWLLPDFSAFDSFHVIERIFNTFCLQPSEYTQPISKEPVCEGVRTPNGCYILKETPKTWEAAEADCVNMAINMSYPGHGHLASLPEQPSNNIVLNMIKDLVKTKTTPTDRDMLDRVFIGGYEESVKFGGNRFNNWRWLDGLQAVDLQGCFMESQAYPEFTNSVLMPLIEPAKCSDHCSTASDQYKYFALKAGTNCSCGDTYGVYGSTSGCTRSCLGDINQHCGGTSKNTIYKIGGAFVDWGYDQPNDFNDYQSCGNIEIFEDRNERMWKMGDKACHDKMNYICKVPTIFCTLNRNSHYMVNTHCVYIENLLTKTWFKARETCRAMSGDLLSIDSADTFNKLKTILDQIQARAPYWMGLVGRLWKWLDGQEFIYTSFMSAAPQSNLKSCLIIESNPQERYGWNDYDCNQQLPYVCYIAQNTEPQTIPRNIEATTANDNVTDTQAANGSVATTATITAATTTADSEVQQTSVEPSSGASTADGQLDVFRIVVIVVCTVFVLVVIIFIGICCWCHNHDKKRRNIHPTDIKDVNAYRPFYGETESPTTSTTALDSETSAHNVGSREYEVPVHNRDYRVATVRQDSVYSYDDLYTSVVRTTAIRDLPLKDEPAKEVDDPKRSKRSKKEKEERREARKEKRREAKRREEEARLKQEEKERNRKERRELRRQRKDKKNDSIHYMTASFKTTSKSTAPTEFAGESMTIKVDASEA